MPLNVTAEETIVVRSDTNAVLNYTIFAPGEEGFRGQYYRNAAGASPQFGQLVMERIDRQINFDWGN
ncbi:MAG: hypothetical protein ACK4OO_07000, partial [bacterium]